MIRHASSPDIYKNEDKLDQAAIAQKIAETASQVMPIVSDVGIKNTE